MKQRGNLDFESVKPIECVVLILVHKQRQQRLDLQFTIGLL